jgi:hypothetical protein
MKGSMNLDQLKKDAEKEEHKSKILEVPNELKNKLKE